MAGDFYSEESYHAINAIGCLLRRLTSLISPRIEARFSGKDLTFSHWVALVLVRDGIAHTCADIARHMSYDSGATTRLVDQLEHRGFLVRTRSKTDRRIVNLTLTGEGADAARSLAPISMSFWNELLKDFSTAEAATLITLLQKLLAQVEDIPVGSHAKAKAAA